MGTDKESREKEDLQDFLEVYKVNNPELASRYVRLVAEIGRETAQNVLARFVRAYEYLGQILPPAPEIALYANTAAWDVYYLKPFYLTSLIQAGRKNPELLVQAKQLCNKGITNTPGSRAF